MEKNIEKQPWQEINVLCFPKCEKSLNELDVALSTMVYYTTSNRIRNEYFDNSLYSEKLNSLENRVKEWYLKMDKLRRNFKFCEIFLKDFKEYH